MVGRARFELATNGLKGHGSSRPFINQWSQGPKNDCAIECAIPCRNLLPYKR